LLQAIRGETYEVRDPAGVCIRRIASDPSREDERVVITDGRTEQPIVTIRPFVQDALSHLEVTDAGECLALVSFDGRELSDPSGQPLARIRQLTSPYVEYAIEPVAEAFDHRLRCAAVAVTLFRKRGGPTASV
jgi:hypothetical protein